MRATLAALCLCVSCAVSIPAARATGPDVRPMTTAGPSMFPALPVAPCVILVDFDPAAFDRIAPGCVAVVCIAGAWTTHRVFRSMGPGVWWTRGDANRFPDRDYLTRQTFVGLVVTPLPPGPSYPFARLLSRARVH